MFTSSISVPGLFFSTPTIFQSFHTFHASRLFRNTRWCSAHRSILLRGLYLHQLRHVRKSFDLTRDLKWLYFMIFLLQGNKLINKFNLDDDSITVTLGECTIF